MSTNIYFECVDNLDYSEITKLLTQQTVITEFNLWNGRLCSRFAGGDMSGGVASERGAKLCEELYGVLPVTTISFGVDKFAPYETSHGNIFDAIICLIKATKLDAVAAINDRPFLRRIDGKITLFNEGGIFDADVIPQWRPKFDFVHDYQEKFVR
jgi:hypothetical protein